jgi:hypothetical protein
MRLSGDAHPTPRDFSLPRHFKIVLLYNDFARLASQVVATFDRKFNYILKDLLQHFLSLKVQ